MSKSRNFHKFICQWETNHKLYLVFGRETKNKISILFCVYCFHYKNSAPREMSYGKEYIPYNKSESTIQIVQNIAAKLPEPPVPSYSLYDCWYTSRKIMEVSKASGFLMIGTLKTNRIIYPIGFPMSIRDFASHLRTKSLAVRLVTVNKLSIDMKANLRMKRKVLF